MEENNFFIPFTNYRWIPVPFTKSFFDKTGLSYLYQHFLANGLSPTSFKNAIQYPVPHDPDAEYAK